MSSVLDRDVQFAAVEPQHIDGEPERVREIRSRAAKRFNTLGWPTTKLEEWKYTSLAALTRIDWSADLLPHAVPPDAVSPMGDHPVAELMFINRVLHANRTEAANQQPGVRILPLAEAMESEGFKQHFGRYADSEKHALTALNTAQWQNGAYIEIAPGTAVEGFIHLFFL